MKNQTRVLRYRRFLASLALSGITALGASAAGPSGVTAVPPPAGSTASVGSATVDASGSSPSTTSAGVPNSATTNTNRGVTPVTPFSTNPATGLNSSPSTSAGTFPTDVNRFSQSSATQSSALSNPAAAATPGTNSQIAAPYNTQGSQGVVPFGNPTPNPAANPQFPR